MCGKTHHADWQPRAAQAAQHIRAQIHQRQKVRPRTLSGCLQDASEPHAADWAFDWPQSPRCNWATGMSAHSPACLWPARPPAGAGPARQQSSSTCLIPTRTTKPLRSLVTPSWLRRRHGASLGRPGSQTPQSRASCSCPPPSGTSRRLRRPTRMRAQLGSQPHPGPPPGWRQRWRLQQPPAASAASATVSQQRTLQPWPACPVSTPARAGPTASRTVSQPRQMAAASSPPALCRRRSCRCCRRAPCSRLLQRQGAGTASRRCCRRAPCPRLLQRQGAGTASRRCCRRAPCPRPQRQGAGTARRRRQPRPSASLLQQRAAASRPTSRSLGCPRAATRRRPT